MNCLMASEHLIKIMVWYFYLPSPQLKRRDKIAPRRDPGGGAHLRPELAQSANCPLLIDIMQRRPDTKAIGIWSDLGADIEGISTIKSNYPYSFIGTIKVGLIN